MNVSLMHQNQPTLEYGTPLSAASHAVVLLHERGATAQGMLSIADKLAMPDVAFVAPQAAAQTWYPQSFLAPLDANEPALSSARHMLRRLFSRVQAHQITPDRVMLLGFSQGACLALDYAARHPQRYGGVVAFSGGLMGPPASPLTYTGDMRGTPVFLGCSDSDPHIPLDRVHESASVFRTLHAAVDTRVYPDMEHTVNDDEIQAARQMLSTMDARSPAPVLHRAPTHTRTQRYDFG